MVKTNMWQCTIHGGNNMNINTDSEDRQLVSPTFSYERPYETTPKKKNCIKNNYKPHYMACIISLNIVAGLLFLIIMLQ